MNVLIKSATVIDPSGPHHRKKRDILIENGHITKIATDIQNTKGIKEVSLDNLHVSGGWFDPGVSFGEPGYEERETIQNGLRTAAASGFTHVGVNTNTNPVADSKSDIKFLRSKAEGSAVSLHPIGALSVGSKGEDLAELYDMKNEGAAAFYDYKIPVTNANLLKIALQYTQAFNGLVQSFPYDRSVSRNGIVNEDVNSTRLGLKGIPPLAEALQVTRDLQILEYTGGRLHIPTISTESSVTLIREAKKKGFKVSCSVAISNLLLTDDKLESFDTNYKLLPPLRTSDNMKALIKGLKSGIIDGVTSDHNPIDVEHKITEFDHAEYGSIGLESCFGALRKVCDIDTAVVALQRLKPAFGISQHPIKEGKPADLTLFDPDVSWHFTEKEILSASGNSAFLGETLKGRPYGIFANKKLVLR